VLEESQSALLIKAAIDEAVGSEAVATLNTLAQRFGIEAWQKSLKDLVDKARANGISAEALAGMADANAQAIWLIFHRLMATI
jgi:hypothetical protein